MIGISLLASACAAMGAQKFLEYLGRLRLLAEMERFFLYLESEISYSKNTMPQIFSEAAKMDFPKLHGWIAEIHGELDKKSSGRTRKNTFAKAWREVSGRWLVKELKADMVANSFLRLGDELGGMDMRAQVKCIGLFLRDLEKEIADTKEQLPVKRKLYLSLGVMAGLFLAVILI